MANIPKLKENISAKASTGVVDRTGVLKEQQRGISDFNQFLQKTIKQGADIVDTKIYASDSSKSHGELLDFMSSTKTEKDKADYLKNNGDKMAGYAAFKAKKNMAEMEKRLSKISHPKARKELEAKMSHHAQKSLISDVGAENRIIEEQTRYKIEGREQVMALDISGMKSETDQDQYEITVAQGLAETQKDINDGFISPEKGIKLQRRMLDSSANLRAKALVEGGDSLSALKSIKRNRFGTVAAQTTTRNYIMSKHLDGDKKGYDLLLSQNDMKREQNEAQTYAIDGEVNRVLNDPNIGEEEKALKIRSLQLKYKDSATSKQSKIISNASYSIHRDKISKVLAMTGSIPYDETNSRTYKNAMGTLRALVDGKNMPSKVKKEASNAISKVIREQKIHEAAVEKKAYDPLKSDTTGVGARQHKAIVAKIGNNPKYKDIAMEAKIGIYNLYKSGQDKRYISIVNTMSRYTSKGRRKTFVISSDKARKLQKERPEIFDKFIMKSIKKNHPDLGSSDRNEMFDKFKTAFDDYNDKVDNFEKHEKDILEQYKGL